MMLGRCESPAHGYAACIWHASRIHDCKHLPSREEGGCTRTVAWRNTPVGPTRLIRRGLAYAAVSSRWKAEVGPS